MLSVFFCFFLLLHFYLFIIQSLLLFYFLLYDFYKISLPIRLNNPWKSRTQNRFKRPWVISNTVTVANFSMHVPSCKYFYLVKIPDFSNTRTFQRPIDSELYPVLHITWALFFCLPKVFVYSAYLFPLGYKVLGLWWKTKNVRKLLGKSINNRYFIGNRFSPKRITFNKQVQWQTMTGFNVIEAHSGFPRYHICLSCYLFIYLILFISIFTYIRVHAYMHTHARTRTHTDIHTHIHINLQNCIGICYILIHF